MTSDDRPRAVTTPPRLEPPPKEKTFIGRASPLKGGGWEIRVLRPDPEHEGATVLVGVTQSASLKQIEERTWDAAHAASDERDLHVTAVPDIGDEVMARVIGAWQAMRDAKEAEAKAAQEIRAVVRELRGMGLSVTDIAWLTHVSRGRVSQLLM